MFRKFIIASFVIFLSLLMLIIFTRYQTRQELRVPTINKLPPPPFEFIEQIIKEGNNYLILFRIPQQKYEGKKIIGNSKVDLEPFIGRKVRIERDESRRPKVGDYPIMAKEQCIKDKCHPIFKDNPSQETEVFDITSIKIIN